MKTLTLLVIGFALSATAVACSPSQRELLTTESSTSGNGASSGLDLRKIEKSYLACLSSGNSGVVESALGQVIYLRIAYPKADLREIQAKLFDLAVQGYTRDIRYKAYVARQVFADPQTVRGAIESTQSTGDEFFAELESCFEH